MTRLAIFVAMMGSCSATRPPVATGATELLIPAEKGSEDPDSSSSWADVEGSREQRIDECTQLIEIINASVERLEDRVGQPTEGDGIGDLMTMASFMDEIQNRAEELHITVLKLRQYRGAYQQIAKSIADGSRELADGLTTGDQDKINAGQGRIEQAVKQEEPLMRALNQFCQAP